MPQQFIILIVAAVALLAIGGISFLSGRGSLDSIKSKPVGDGQHGTARWATPAEIDKTFARVPFKPSEWRQGKELPKAQGLVLGSQGKKGKITALVDEDDIHCLMIGVGDRPAKPHPLRRVQLPDVGECLHGSGGGPPERYGSACQGGEVRQDPVKDHHQPRW